MGTLCVTAASSSLVDCSKVGFKMCGTCSRWMLFSDSTLFLPSDSFLPILLFLILFISLPTSECRRRGAAGRLRCRLGSGGAATTPGTALGPGGCHPRGRPGLSRAPARTPQSPKSHWEVWVGEARNGDLEEALKAGFLPQ